MRGSAPPVAALGGLLTYQAGMLNIALDGFMIVAAFAVLAAILATVGLYGVTVRAVVRRSREIGIRVALGATPSRASPRRP